MPSNLLAIDSNFPTFTGEEPEEEQIRQLVNYLYQLRESLQYSLQNLSRENFNAVALDKLTEEASKEIVEQLEKIQNTMSQLDQEIEALQGRISKLDELQKEVGELEQSVEELRGACIQKVEIEEVTTV